MQCSLTAGAAGAWRSRPPPKGGVRLDTPTSALLFSSRKSKWFERTSSSLVTFQDLELQNFKHLAQPNLGTMGEKVGPAPSLSTCCWTLLRCSQWRKGWLWAWLVTGATGSRKPAPGPSAQDPGTHLHVSAFPEQGRGGLWARPPPRRAEVRSLLAEWRRKQGDAKRLLKARNVFTELTFLSVIFQV